MSQAWIEIVHVQFAIHPKRQVPQDWKEVLHPEGIHRSTKLVASRPICQNASLQVQRVRDVAHWQQQRHKATETLKGSL